MARGRLEIEVKLRVASAGEARRLLREGRARRLGTVHELNTLYDTPDGALGHSKRLLRLRRLRSVSPTTRPTGRKAREHAERGILTFKGPAEGGKYKVREELELKLDHPGRAGQILEALGFQAWFRYEKYRSTYRLPGLADLLVELDETPVGDFFELEGSRRSIDRAAKRMGYRPDDYLTVSYYEIFLQERDRRGLPRDAMLFSARKSPKPRVLS